MVKRYRRNEGEEARYEGGIEGTFPLRPIFTRNGAITFDFDSSNMLSVYNATTCDFKIQKMGIITSLCNSRMVNVTASRTYEWFSKNHVEATVIFGNSFADDYNGNQPKRRDMPLNGRIAKRNKTKTAKHAQKNTNC